MPPAIRRGDINVAERSFDWVDPDFFKVMPMPAVAGDPGAALEAPDALVLSRSAARKYFGVDAPIGGVLQVDGHPMRVAAVIRDIPANSHLTGDVFASSKSAFSAFKAFAGGGMLANINLTYVRLRPGATAESVAAGLPSFVQRRMLPDARRYAAAAADRAAAEAAGRASTWSRPTRATASRASTRGWWPPSASSPS